MKTEKYVKNDDSTLRVNFVPFEAPSYLDSYSVQPAIENTGSLPHYPLYSAVNLAVLPSSPPFLSPFLPCFLPPLLLHFPFQLFAHLQPVPESSTLQAGGVYRIGFHSTKF